MSKAARRRELAESVLDGPVELYSVYGGLVHLTDSAGKMTFVELICDDAAGDALVGYLKEAGAPCFDDREVHDAYLELLRKHLKEGMTPSAARAAAHSLASAPRPE